jgi:hypothetical protein
MIHDYFNADLHCHLSNWRYPRSFDKYIDFALARLGNEGALGVDAWANDGKYEYLISLPSRKYKREDVDGRATLVRSRENSEEIFYLVNGNEIVSNVGHFLLSGIEKDVILPSGRGVHWQRIVEECQKNNAALFIVHPFVPKWGSGRFFRENPDELNNFHGIEVTNGNAYFPFPKPFVNREAYDFFVEMHRQYPHLGGVKFHDSHSKIGIGRTATKMLGRIDPNSFMPSLFEGIRSCTPERLDEHKEGLGWGLVEGGFHGFQSLTELIYMNCIGRGDEL